MAICSQNTRKSQTGARLARFTDTDPLKQIEEGAVIKSEDRPIFVQLKSEAKLSAIL